MNAALKMTEDQTIELLIRHLIGKGWQIDSYCLGQTRGCDIIAVRKGIRIYIEAKGARAADNTPTKRRQYFSSGQIKTHYGKAIVKMLELKSLYPNAQFAIAHPDDISIRTYPPYQVHIS